MLETKSAKRVLNIFFFTSLFDCKLTHELGRKLPLRLVSRTLSIDSEPIGGAVELRLPC